MPHPIKGNFTTYWGNATKEQAMQGEHEHCSYDRTSEHRQPHCGAGWPSAVRQPSCISSTNPQNRQSRTQTGPSGETWFRDRSARGRRHRGQSPGGSMVRSVARASSVFASKGSGAASRTSASHVACAAPGRRSPGDRRRLSDPQNVPATGRVRAVPRAHAAPRRSRARPPRRCPHGSRPPQREQWRGMAGLSSRGGGRSRGH